MWDLKEMIKDFPGDPVVKTLPANAGHRGSVPDLGRLHMPHGNEACAPQLLSLRSTACALQEKLLQWAGLASRQWVEPAHHSEDQKQINK